MYSDYERANRFEKQIQYMIIYIYDNSGDNLPKPN